MSKYTDAVEHNLKGLTAVSPGICGGCTECADAHGYKAEYEWPEEEEQAEEDRMVKFDEAVSSGKVNDEGSFSWSGCGVCGSHLGGNLYVWHALYEEDLKKPPEERTLLHFDDACTDCVMFLANGDEPDSDEDDDDE